MANLVWSLPQFSLATAAIRQNLLPGVFGTGVMPDTTAKWAVGGTIMLICVSIAWFYNSGSTGIKIFNVLLKLMVGLIVLCFFGVVVRMSFEGGLVNWAHVLRGFIPDLRLLSAPAKTFAPLLADVEPAFRQFWTDMIVAQQRDVMISAASTAVGINMTFLLPYSMLNRGWDREFRGLAIFDLSTGLFIPFLMATSCVVIASAAQFHAHPAAGLLADSHVSGQQIVPPKNIQAGYEKNALLRIEYELGGDQFRKLSDSQKKERIAALPPSDQRMAATLVKRDAFNLANSLAPLTGDVFAHVVFGFGVVGIAISSIIILMLINGFVVCEMLGRPWKGWPYRIGTLMPCLGLIGPFIWTGGKAQFWLAVPTSMFAMVLLPVAYLTFVLMMNSKSVLGQDVPRGGKRVAWNVLMGIAAGFAALGSIWSLWSKLHWIGIGVAVAFIGVATVVQIARPRGIKR